MKSTNFSYNGGFPFDQSTLQRLQAALFEQIKTFALQLGCQETGNYILYGCKVVGANITPGAMFIDGEICPFAGAVGTASTKIKKITTTTNAAFENGTNPPVFIETVAQVDPLGTMLSSFISFNFVNDANYVHTDNNFTALLLAKLNGIESGAEVNVQANWNEINPLSDSFIKNKPTFLSVLLKSTMLIGDIWGNDVTVNFPSVGTSNYDVFPSFETPYASAAANSATYVYLVHSKTPTSFVVRMSETGGQVQNLSMNYLIIAK